MEIYYEDFNILLFSILILIHEHVTESTGYTILNKMLSRALYGASMYGH